MIKLSVIFILSLEVQTSRHQGHARQAAWLTALKVHSHQSNPLAFCNQPVDCR
jgi:hypothetical protein